MKKAAWVILLLAVVLVGSWFLLKNKQEILSLPTTTIHTLAHVVLQPSTDTLMSMGVVDDGFTVQEKKNPSGSSTKQYDVMFQDKRVGILTFTSLPLAETGDFYYFVKYLPAVTLEQPLRLQVTVNSQSAKLTERHISYPAHEQRMLEQNLPLETPPRLEDGQISEALFLTEAPSLLDRLTGWLLASLPVIVLPANSLFLDGGDFSFHLNRVHIYEPLGSGVRKADDLLSPSPHYMSKGNQHYLQISLPHLMGKEIEHWGIAGSAGMFAWNNGNQVSLYTVANLDRVRKWTEGGFQYITPTTYEPYDENGFWLVPAQHVGNRLLLAGQDRFSENIALLSLQAALDTQLSEGMWVTKPHSSWLYEDYGIEAGFYDTRFSTDAGLFLLEGYRKYEQVKFLEGATHYADFLVEFAETHHFPTENGGYLVYDYRDGDWQTGEPKKETHVSLNHLVTEMNFLYEIYNKTKFALHSNSNINTQHTNISNPEMYLYTAEKIRLAVQETKENWKKEENGDLWYAYLPDGSYGLLDYPLLTLKDLRYSQRLIEEIHGERDEAFQYLIEVKEEYLRKNGLPLYD